MHQHQQPPEILDRERGMRLGLAIVYAHCHSLTVFSHLGMGPRLLSQRGWRATVLLILLAGFSANRWLFLYLVAFLAAQLFQRIYTGVRLARGERMHSRSDGDPVVAMRLIGWLGIKPAVARLMIEPSLLLGLGLGIAGVADAYGIPDLYALAWYVGLGCLSTAIDELVFWTTEDRRLRAMQDQRIEMERLAERFREGEEGY